MKKYKDVYKKLPFWFIVISLSVLEMMSFVIKYDVFYFGGFLGMFVGSFIFCSLIYAIIFLIQKGISKNKKIIIKSTKS